MCQGTDRQGGRYLVAMGLVDDRIDSIIYRRSGDLLVCEVEAFRRSDPSPRQQSRWVDNGNRSDVFVRQDGRDVAHIRLTWRGRRIEIQMVDYDQAALCGTGREFLPEFTVILDGPRC